MSKIISIGRHAVSHGSIMDSQVDEIMHGKKAHVLYSDPPWGDGNIKYWATINKKMTGDDSSQPTHSEMMSRILWLVDSYVEGHVFIETGERWADEWGAAFKAKLKNVKQFSIKYKSGSGYVPNILLYGGTDDRYSCMSDPSGMSGLNVAKTVISSARQDGAIVFDPCCGMGYTAEAACLNGMIFRGNELNSARLQKTISRLRKHE